jgi:hypothetical protein
MARRKETTLNRRTLFPISIVPLEAIRAWRLFDVDLGIDSVRRIREYFVPDFSAWNDHDNYTLQAVNSSARAARGAPAAR